MFLSFLDLTNFRNIEKQGINFTQGITVLWGDNGGGKTNLLESIYFLSYLRPLRRCGSSQLIKHNKGDSQVKGTVQSGGSSEILAVHLKRGGRVHSSRYRQATNTYKEHIGGLYSVAFVPDDIRNLFGAPQGRRRLLDQSATMVRPMHMDVLVAFTRCLRQRNRLLWLIRDGKAKQEVLEPFDQELRRLSEELTGRRSEILDKISGNFKDFFAAIDGSDSAKLVGQMKFDPEEFDQRRAKDIARGSTTYGPHRDDFSFTAEGKDAMLYASQGRKRIMSIAIRLSQAMLLYDISGLKPVLLLDDITSEIDPGRRRRLLKTVENLGFQTIITSTDGELIFEGFSGEIRTLKVQRGSIL